MTATEMIIIWSILGLMAFVVVVMNAECFYQM